MGRAIKFRAWHTEQKQWWYIVIEPTPEEIDDADCISFGSPAYKVLSPGFTHWGQYTGFADKNGKKIYEEDLVLINHPQDMTGDFTNKLGRVFWWDEEGGWYHGHESVRDGSGRPPKRMWPYVEVIGNVYENPELLQTGGDTV